MTRFQIALYAACRVAVAPDWQLRSVADGTGTFAVMAKRRGPKEAPSGTLRSIAEGRTYYVLVDALNLEREVARPGWESSWDKAIRRAVEGLLRELPMGAEA